MAEGMVRERLNIYYLLDTSGSMSGSRIQQLNTVMQELKPVLEESAIDHNVEIVVRAIEFGNGETAKWHEGSKSQGTAIDSWIWTNLNANGGCTPTSVALEMTADALDPEYLGARTLRPVIILVTDGGCTDGRSAYSSACTNLANKIKGNSIRIAIGVENANKTELEEFATRGIIGEQTNQPFVFEVNDPEAMAAVIRWSSVVSIAGSVKATVNPEGEDDGNAVDLGEPADQTWI
jgi:uncharacterized protein YegL